MSESSLSIRQKQMINYLMDHNNEIGAYVVDQGSVTTDARLAIYRNAYRVRLKETLETDHEILGFILGDELFDEMAAGYIEAYPSRNKSLRDYANQLPKFLAETEPFSEHPIIGELATFERLLLSAFDAGEGQRLDQEQLAVLPAEDWPNMQLKFHPSMQLFHTQWNSVDSWQAIKAGRAPDAAALAPGTWLLWRNRERLTEFASLSSEEHQILEAALSGVIFADLCEVLLEGHPEETAGQVAVEYLVSWMQRGVILAVSTS
jgi:hypothetical protein